MLHQIPYSYQYQPTIIQTQIPEQNSQNEKIVEIKKTNSFTENIVMEKKGQEIQQTL